MGHEQMLEYGFVLLIWVHGAARSLLEIVELIIYGLVHEIEEDGEADLVVLLELLQLRDLSRQRVRVHLFKDVVFQVTLLLLMGFFSGLGGAWDKDDEVWPLHWSFDGHHLVRSVEIRDLVVQHLCFQVLKEIRPSGFILGAVSPFSPSIIPL